MSIASNISSIKKEIRATSIYRAAAIVIVDHIGGDYKVLLCQLPNSYSYEYLLDRYSFTEPEISAAKLDTDFFSKLTPEEYKGFIDDHSGAYFDAEFRKKYRATLEIMSTENAEKMISDAKSRYMAARKIFINTMEKTEARAGLPWRFAKHKSVDSRTVIPLYKIPRYYLQYVDLDTEYRYELSFARRVEGSLIQPIPSPTSASSISGVPCLMQPGTSPPISPTVGYRSLSPSPIDTRWVGIGDITKIHTDITTKRYILDNLHNILYHYKKYLEIGIADKKECWRKG